MWTWNSCPCRSCTLSLFHWILTDLPRHRRQEATSPTLKYPHTPENSLPDPIPKTSAKSPTRKFMKILHVIFSLEGLITWQKRTQSCYWKRQEALLLLDDSVCKLARTYIETQGTKPREPGADEICCGFVPFCFCTRTWFLETETRTTELPQCFRSRRGVEN